MEVIVLKTFRDANHDKALRNAGDRYNERDKKRVADLEKSGWVKVVDQKSKIETPTATPKTQTKSPRKSKKANK